jgi:hypothetical protein
MGYRELKIRIGHLLAQDDLEAALETICRIPGRQAVNPLFSFFYSTEEQIRWHAISAMGVVVGRMAGTAMESARVVMRRLMWNLNDESGGIGWGSPEAMGEITAGHPGLANEFACILVSYINPTGNFLEHESSSGDPCGAWDAWPMPGRHRQHRQPRSCPPFSTPPTPTCVERPSGRPAPSWMMPSGRW